MRIKQTILKRKRPIFTLIFLLLSLGLIFKLEISASAQVPEVEPFLYPPFHGSAAVSSVFDHQTPRNIDSNDGVIVIMQRRRRSSRIKSGSTFSTTDEFQKLSPEEFEELVTKLFISQGHQAKRMGGQGDHGVDIKVLSKNGEKWIVQCKRWNGSIGEPTIRDLYGVLNHMNAGRAVLITSGTFTDQARTWAEGKPFDLVDGKMLLRLISKANGS